MGHWFICSSEVSVVWGRRRGEGGESGKSSRIGDEYIV